MATYVSTQIPEPRNATDIPELNFVLYLMGGIPLERRKGWMRKLFPRTMLLLESRRYFTPPITKRRTARTGTREYED